MKINFRYIFKEWILTLGIAAIVAFFFRSVVASPRHIPTGSMIPTIKVGEFIFVKMFSYDWHVPYTRKSLVKRADPQRGEVAVFEYPVEPDKDYIKRVIGVPGDTIEIRDKRVILNGRPLPLEKVEDQSILADLAPEYDPKRLSLFKETNGDHTYYVMHMNGKFAPDMEAVVVPPGQYFVMGDNRDNSHDSRFWGFVERDQFLGEGSFIWFSFDKNHFPFLRFSRFFSGIH